VGKPKVVAGLGLVAILLSWVALSIYFSPYYSCVRAANAADLTTARAICADAGGQDQAAVE